VFFLDWFKAYTHWSVPFMMSAFYLFCICSAVLVAVSLLTPDPVSAERETLSWRNPFEALQGQAWRGLGDFRVLAGVLFATMVVLYYIFA